MSISDIERQIIEEFGQFSGWLEKYDYLIELGKTLPQIEPEFKKENNLIKGCQSQVWLHAEFREGKVVFTADSDAVITKGIVSLLIRVLSDQTPDDIIKTDMKFVDEIGLREHLSPTRANGLVSMIKQMKLFALVYKTKLDKENPA